jgi:hypothetical protein
MAVADQSDRESATNRHAVILDIDNTLTPPRRPLEADMAQTLRSLSIPFFLGAGGDLRLALEQFIEPLYEFGYRGTFDAFLCNGPTRYRCELFETISTRLIRGFEMRQHLGEERFEEVLRIVQKVLDLNEFKLPATMRIIGDRIVDRRSMINVAPIGRPLERLTSETHTNRDLFRHFDEQTGFRRNFLARLSRELASFAADGLFISLGGETSFDIVINGNDKSFPLRALLDEGFERVWYVGDALFEGGNDEAVLKFIQLWPGARRCPVEAIQVQSWRDTIGVLVNLGIVKMVGSTGW